MEQSIRQGRQIAETKQSAHLKERLDSLKNRYNLLGSKVRLELHLMHGNFFPFVGVCFWLLLPLGMQERCGKVVHWLRGIKWYTFLCIKYNAFTFWNVRAVYFENVASLFLFFYFLRYCYVFTTVDYAFLFAVDFSELKEFKYNKRLDIYYLKLKIQVMVHTNFNFFLKIFPKKRCTSLSKLMKYSLTFFMLLLIISIIFEILMK